MSARLPRGKGVGKLTHSSEEYKKQAKCSTRTSAARTVQQGGAAPASDHPWAGFGEWLLQPLPAEWRYNIQRTLRCEAARRRGPVGVHPGGWGAAQPAPAQVGPPACLPISAVPCALLTPSSAAALSARPSTI